jgi:hypothetical protein
LKALPELFIQVLRLCQETDPDSRLIFDGATKAYVQADNAQTVVDEQAQIIVAASVTQEANEREQLAPLLAEVQQNVGPFPPSIPSTPGIGIRSSSISTK